jgi:hypothetical protein
LAAKVTSVVEEAIMVIQNIALTKELEQAIKAKGEPSTP